MKKIIFSFITGLILFASASSVQADGTTTKEVCSTNQYGETTCTTTTETEEIVVHEPIDTAIGDINPAFLSVVLFAGAYFTYKTSLRLK
jgi:hypothetical protein